MIFIMMPFAALAAFGFFACCFPRTTLVLAAVLALAWCSVPDDAPPEHVVASVHR